MKYKKLRGIILKKQNYREADQIVTIWTRETGKIRVLAKSLRKPSSKLNFAMAELGEVEIDLVGSNLPTLIGAKPLQQFSSLREDLLKMATGFYAAELLLKLTADEHPNESAFSLMLQFLSKLDQSETLDNHALIDQFALNLAEVLGFGNPVKVETHKDVLNFIEELIERNLRSETLLNQIGLHA